MTHQLLTTALCTMAGTMLAGAQVPGLINYQGRLTDANGAPVTGSKNFTISIYDAATGGNLLYTESIGAVTLDDNGVYSFQFGSAGTSNSQVTETLATTDASTLVYTKALANSGVVENSLSVTDGTNSWTQSTGNPGIGAAATANITAGFVTGATITNGGSGYTSPPEVTITGLGNGAAATATVTGGVVTGITITNAGSGYTGGATITIAPPVIPFRVDYSGGAITATYSTAPASGSTITATYRYGTDGVTGALAKAAEHWMTVSVDGTAQVTKQRILTVPYALKAANADQATTVIDGAITAEKLSPTAFIEAMSNSGSMITSKTHRPDLLAQGYQLHRRVGNELIDIETFNAPSPRDSHTAVWTGSEMIIWGGLNFTSNIEIRHNTGSQYNPTTNTWKATSTTNAPISRNSHTAVWTGSEMLIWGGTGDNNTPLFNGSRFNPTTNTWTTISTLNAPSAPSAHTAVWTGSEMIIWGGRTSTNSASFTVNTGSRYNPKTDTWTTISTLNAPSSRHSHTAVWTGSEMIIWGGRKDSYTRLNNGSRYNPTTNTWTTISNSNAPNPRGSHAAVWTGSEMIIWGGIDDPYTPHLNDGSRYNPTTNTWTAVSNANAPSGRGDQAAVWTGSEMIVWGGRGLSEGTINTGSCYNPTSNTWTTISNSNAPKPRESHTAVWTGSEMIVWGGSSGSFFFNSGARYTPGYIDFYSKF